jgi:Spy/CpxP family protein refolding chaperone
MADRRFPKVLALGLAATLAMTAAAWAGGPDKASSGGHGYHRMQDKLGLTDEQVAAIKEINARRAGERKQLVQSLRQARAELKQAALNGGDVKAKAAAVTALVGQMTELRAATLQEISPILTPEQREAMTKMDLEHRHHRGPRPTQS